MSSQQAQSGGKGGLILGVVMTTLLAVENVVLPVSGIVQFKPHPISEAVAITFLNEHYFPTVVSDPDLALVRWTTENFRMAKQQEGLQNFRAYWKAAKSIPAESVRATLVADRDERDTFEMSFKRNLRAGGSDKRLILMRFVCASWSQAYVPTRRCAVDNLRLEFTRGLTGTRP